MNLNVKDLRTDERYVVIEPLVGSFGAARISVIDIAEQGAQIEHPQPLRLGARGRLWFKRGDIAASVHALVIWSRLSQTPGDDGKLLYRSGLRLDEAGGGFAGVIQELADQGVIGRDTESLDRKRRKFVERERKKSVKPSVKRVKTDDISVDQELLVQQARERLLADPDEASRWYSRARYAIVQTGMTVSAEIRNRQDVLAVWEYLERSLPLSAIVRLIDKRS